MLDRADTATDHPVVLQLTLLLIYACNQIMTDNNMMIR